MFSVRVKTFKFLGTNILIEHLTWTHNTQQIINDSSSQKAEKILDLTSATKHLFYFFLCSELSLLWV